MVCNLYLNKYVKKKEKCLASLVVRDMKIKGPKK